MRIFQPTVSGSLTVTGNITSSNVIYVNNPTAGAISAQFGTSIPFYVTANWPTLGFNAYYDAGWRWGAGSSNKYGAFQSIDPSTVEMIYYFSTTGGNAGSLWGGSQRLVFAMYPDGRIRVPATFTEPSLVSADTDGYFSQIPITGSTYPISVSSASYAATASYVANASSFPYTGSAQITGSLGVTGSVSVSGNSTFNPTVTIQNPFYAGVKTVLGGEYGTGYSNISLYDSNGVEGRIWFGTYDFSAPLSMNIGMNIFNPGIVGTATAKINNIVKSGLAAYGAGYGFNWAFTAQSSGYFTQAERSMWLTPYNSLVIYSGSSAPIDSFSEKGGAFEIYAATASSDVVPYIKTQNNKIIKLYAQGPVTSSQGLADALTNLGLLTGSSVINTTSSYALTASYTETSATASYVPNIAGTSQFIPKYSGTYPSASNTFASSPFYVDSNNNIILGATGGVSSKLWIVQGTNGATGLTVNTISGTNITSLQLNNNSTNGYYMYLTSGSDITLELTTNGIGILSGSLTATKGFTGSLQGIVNTPGTSSTADADFTINSALYQQGAWISSFTSDRTLKVSNLIDGNSVRVYIRNTNASARSIQLTAATDTITYSNVECSNATAALYGGGSLSTSSISLPATSGTVTVWIANIGGTFVGSIS